MSDTLSLIRIISGAQTGADQGALRAAKALGLLTGGYMPRGWCTDDGPSPNFESLYGMRQTTSSYYPQRTRMNVIESDGTLIWGRLNSPGCLLTLKYCEQYGKPHFSCVWTGPLSFAQGTPDKMFLGWLRMNSIRTLNVAGNREKTNPGINEAVYQFLTSVLKLRSTIQ